MGHAIDRNTANELLVSAEVPEMEHDTHHVEEKSPRSQYRRSVDPVVPNDWGDTGPESGQRRRSEAMKHSSC
jgi:hypothetical protein